MRYEDFKRLRTGESYIICHNRYEDMPGGWSNDMDDLLNTPLLVYDKNKESVYVQHPNGKHFHYHYEYIEVFLQVLSKSILWNNKKLKSVDNIAIHLLDGMSLKEDIIQIHKHIKAKEEDTLYLSAELLEKFQKYCPRIIGVLLSNNYLKECT